MKAAGSALVGIFFLLFCLFLTKFDTDTVELMFFVSIAAIVLIVIRNGRNAYKEIKRLESRRK